MKKRMISFLLACVLLVGLFPVFQAEAFYSSTDIPYAVEGGNIYFNKSTGGISAADSTVTKAVIPEEIDGVTVVGLDSSAFAYSQIQSVSIPDSVKRIDDRAFGGCTELKEIRLGNGIETIDPSAFNDCAYFYSEENWESDVLYIDGCLIKARESISGEYAVKPDTYMIASRAFMDCSLLEKITLPEGLLCIDGEAFYQCAELSEIIIPDHVYRIGGNAFYGCSAMETIILGDGLKSIQGGAFVGTAYYENVSNWEEGLLIIDQYLIRADRDIVEMVTVPQGIVLIADGAFSICPLLTEVVIPDDVLYIGPRAFGWSSSLQRVVLPKNLKELGDGMFSRCLNLSEVNLPAGLQSIGAFAFEYCGALKEINIPDQVHMIGREAFLECKQLHTIHLPKELQKIDYSTFQDCDALISINIPGNVKTIEAYAFRDCDSLKEAFFGEKVSSIGEFAFYGCESLEGAYFCGDAPEVGDSAFTHYTSYFPLPKMKFYYLEGKAGWTTPKWGIYPTTIWDGHIHEYDKMVTEPTCTEEGYTAYSCVCGASYVVETVSRLDHEYSDWVIIKEPTCTESGMQEKVCYDCGRTEHLSISPTGHNYEVEVIPPTCTEQGCTMHTCTNCGDSFATDCVEETGHGEAEIRDACEATCAEDGCTGNAYCTVCGEMIDEGEEIPALGHSFEDGFCSVCGGEDPDYLPSNPFTDVKESDYYYAPVLWAVKKGVTTGTTSTTFSPEDPCTRGQIVTFLWRAFGSPEPTKTDNPFTDVAESMYYYKAVLWAVEQGITTGTSATTFSPEDTCTRGQVATFLWRACGKPTPENSENPFSDVPETMYYYEPILWAVEEGVTNGTGNGEFSPDDSCTRGQIVTFLYRALEK